MKDNTLVKIKKILLITFSVLVVGLFIFLLYQTKDTSLTKKVKEFVKTDTKVLYISNQKNYSNYPIELFNKYEIEYLYVDSTNFSKVEKTKLEKFINSKYLNNIIVIYENGEIKDALIEYDTEEKLNEFLIKNEIIPEEFADISNIFPIVEDSLEEDLMMLYIPYKKTSNMSWQNYIYEAISDTYDIPYKKIDAYLLSKTQQNKLNTLLQISEVEDQIVILIKNKKIIGSIRGVMTKRKHLIELNKYNFIDKTDDYINYIDINTFESLVSSNNKNIIVIGKDDCKYCEELLTTFNNLINSYDIEVSYINVKNFDTNEAKKVQEILSDLKYTDGFTTPLTIIVEKNKLIDYSIGLSDEEYFTEIFKELGIIKDEEKD